MPNFDSPYLASVSIIIILVTTSSKRRLMQKSTPRRIKRVGGPSLRKMADAFDDFSF